MKQDTTEPLALPSLHFHLQFSQNHPPHNSLFLTKINPPPSGQISDETGYTWWHLALTSYPDGSQSNPITLTTITQAYIYFLPFLSWSVSYLLILSLLFYFLYIFTSTLAIVQHVSHYATAIPRPRNQSRRKTLNSKKLTWPKNWPCGKIGLGRHTLRICNRRWARVFVFDPVLILIGKGKKNSFVLSICYG